VPGKRPAAAPGLQLADFCNKIGQNRTHDAVAVTAGLPLHADSTSAFLEQPGPGVITKGLGVSHVASQHIEPTYAGLHPSS
jgi:hypothetical protein